MDDPIIGPDGTFPLGSPTMPNDRGGGYAAFYVLKEKGAVALDFGTVLNWISTTPEAALIFAANVRERIYAAFGRLEYDPTTFPLRVVANIEKQTIETFLPSTQILAANPEVFLVWSDKLEDASNIVFKHRKKQTTV